MQSFYLLPATILAIFCRCTWAGDDPVDPNAKGGYFVYKEGDVGPYVVAINAIEDGDILMHMSAPAVHSWMGVGIGENMPGSFMLVSYASENGAGVITNPRRATGHSEPNLIEGLEVEYIYSDEYAPNANTAAHGGLMIAHMACRGCTNLTSLDFTNTAQPFIFALGPKRSLMTDDPATGLRRHDYYGHFTMDMTVAVSNMSHARVPAPNEWSEVAVAADSTFASSGTSPPYGTHADGDFVATAHGICMCVAFVFVFPLGAILLRALRSVLWHVVAQTLGLVLVAIGVGLGVSVSLEYNLTKHFNSAHQGLGLFIFAAVLIQFGLGLTNHRVYRRTKQPSIFGKVHLCLGPAVIVLAFINGGLGFILAGISKRNIPYAVIVLVFGIVFLALRLWLLIKYRVPTLNTYEPEDVDHEAYFANLGTQMGYGGYVLTPTTATFDQSAGANVDYEMKDHEYPPMPEEPQRVSVAPPKLTLQTGYHG